MATSVGSSINNILWASWNQNVTWVDTQVGDFNGAISASGKRIMGLTSRYLQGGSWWTAISTGNSFTTSPSPWAQWSTAPTWVDVQVGDFNGDGKDDITARYLEGGSWWTGISTGSPVNATMWAQWSTA